MPQIQLLPDHLINKIAAGEVIENTASVVKELVENALDAGATEIIIEILGGGRQMIRVSDNGCGMSRDDAFLCLERHATSKLRKIDDLDTLTTMGFRGEAIPSIASISKMTLITSNGQRGTLLIIEGGTVLKESDAVREQGTTFEVKSLFFNVPVRKKFQRSPAYDTQEIVKFLKGIALAHLQAGFQLISDGTPLLAIPSFDKKLSDEERLKKRIGAILGEEFLQKGRWISCEKENKKIMGVVGMPGEAKHQKNGQILLVNGRIVRAPLIAQAVRDGYGSSLTEQRHPIYCLVVNIPSDIIDVNVHPQKREIRLSEEGTLRSWIAESVEKALWKRDETKSLNSSCQPPRQIQPMNPTLRSAPLPIPRWEETTFKSVENTLSAKKQPLADQIEFTSPIIPRIITTLPGYAILDPSTLPEEWKTEKNEGLYFLDQKRAYHRIIYEQMKAQETAEISQTLIIPYIYECETEDYASLLEILPDLQKIGISVKEFGGKTFMIDALPSQMQTKDPSLLITQFLEEWKENRTLHLKEKERWLIKLSARISNGKKKTLLPQEAQNLINSLLKCNSSTRCPLGKPTILCLDKEALDKIGGID